MSETKAVANKVLNARQELKRQYDADVARLDAVELSIARAEQMAVAWKNSAKGRDAAVWLYTSAFTSVTLVLILNRGDEFGAAADQFAEAIAQFSTAFPRGWVVREDEEARDATYSPETAARAISIHARPAGVSYTQEVSATVRVELPVGEGDACRVIKVGERPAYTSSYSRPTPVYKALCPGDALPLGGA